jgi:hypothetical protein
MNPTTHRCVRFLMASLVVVGLSVVAHADVKTWTGAVDDQWSTAGNWSGGVPGAGDVLLFPSGAAHTTNTKSA